MLLIAISAAGGLAGVSALLFAIAKSGPTPQDKASLSIRNEQSRIVIDTPTAGMTSRPARIESSVDFENTGDVAIADIRATVTYDLGDGWKMVANTNVVDVGDIGAISPHASRTIRVSTPVTLSAEALQAYRKAQAERYSFYPIIKIKGVVSYSTGDSKRRTRDWVSDLYAARQGS
jgi:hypothetical protein